MLNGPTRQRFQSAWADTKLGAARRRLPFATARLAHQGGQAMTAHAAIRRLPGRHAGLSSRIDRGRRTNTVRDEDEISSERGEGLRQIR